MAAKPLDNRTIVIAGGGIGGLTTALTLAREGLRVIVLEQSPEPKEFGAGIQVSPNASRILLDLGLGDALKAKWSLPESIKIFKSRTGAMLNSVPLGKAARDRYGAPYGVIHRADLLQLLHQACVLAQDVELHYGEQVDELAAHPRGVTIQTAQNHEFTGIGLVGADGLNSMVRKRIVDDGPPQNTGFVAWRGMISARRLPDGFSGRYTGLWLDKNLHVVHYPIRKGLWVNVVAVVRQDSPGDGWSHQSDPEILMSKTKSLCREIRNLLGRVKNWQTWTLRDRRPAKFISDGPVALLGDAAHPVLPFTAQGGAMAIEDAEAIANALVETDCEVPQAFRLYENRRLTRIARVWQESRKNSWIYHLPFPLSVARDLRIKNSRPEDLLTRYDWLYGGGGT